ncbi:MAG: imidazole glycerol phosphate synthase subunit HisF [Myxococcota bacterium]
MLTKRIIPCLDVHDGRVVKGVNFVDLRDAGDPVEVAERYSDGGADEITFLDITASSDGRKTILSVIEKTAERLAVPLTVGGGVRSLSDVQALLDAGADKVSVNTAAVENPSLIEAIAGRYGCQVLVVAIDARRSVDEPDEYEVVTHGGRRVTELRARSWAQTVAKLGAGEILLTSMDRDGTQKGYDLRLTRTIADAVRIPLIASGGVGGPEDIRAGFTEGRASAALAASIFHDGHFTIAEVKAYLERQGVPVRPPEGDA